MANGSSEKQIGRREFLKLGAVTAAAAAASGLGLGRALGQSDAATQPAGAGTAGSRPGRRPNIVFVFSDEHRWCSLPFTQTPQVIAPNMTALAKQGTRFDNCCSTSPICIPYRAMLITGLWPHQSSAVSNDYFGNHKVIGGETPTLAQIFHKAGYATGYVGKWHLSNETVYDAGFDYFKHWLYGDNHWETPVRDVPSHEEFKKVKGYNAIGMTDQALDFLKQQARGDKPFLLMLSINPPHFRWDDAPEEDVKLYPQDKLPWRPNVTQERWKTGNNLRDFQHYNAHISAVDREVGRVMAALKEQGIEDNTILIYTSDHGSSFGSNGVSSKANPYEEAARVPFLVRWPGHIAADKVADNNLGTIDLYPTLCGLAGITPPAHCGGQDFSAAILGKGGPDPKSQLLLVNNFQRNYFRTELDPKGENIFYPFRGVRTKQYTFAVYAQGDWLLFDNQKDPYQQKNLVNDPAFAGVKADLRKELDAWLAKAEDPFIPEDWKKLSLPERIAAENRHYSVLPYQKQWDKYKADAVARYLKGATPGQQKQLLAAADRVYDERFFGRYKALHFETTTDKRNSKRPLDDIKVELGEHETMYENMLREEADKILGNDK